MGMKKALEKEIDCHISIKNNHWHAFVLSLAGSLGLIFTGLSLVKNFFIGLGIIFIVFTYFPPHLPIFQDANTGLYGIVIHT